MKVHLFIPCFIDQLYPTVAFNMIKVLEKAGCEVHYNSKQTCCGQPAFNAGFWGESKEVCTKFLEDFEGAEYIVAPSASCVGFVRNMYAKLFDNSAHLQLAKRTAERIFELSEFLVNILQVTDLGASFEGKATYHDSCAGLRECHIKSEPRTLLGKVAGLELVEISESETCCGFGGTFAVKFEPISIAMGEQKITNAIATNTDYIISTDMSCLMHIDGCLKNNGSTMKVMHLADILASGY